MFENSNLRSKLAGAHAATGTYALEQMVSPRLYETN